MSAGIVFVFGTKIFGPHDYPAGDPRNEPLFWAVVGLALLLVVSVLVVAAIRTLRRGATAGEKDD